MRMREEINLYKGRCTNLQRDIELSSTAVNKLASDTGSMGEQLALYKNRIQQLEDDLARVTEEKTDHLFDIRRLTSEKERLETDFKALQLESVKNQGNSQTSGATINRLQSQLAGQKNDFELMMTQKSEFERVIKAQKEEILEAEKKATDYYN